MSEASIRRIYESFVPRTAGIDSVETGMGLLTDFVTALARDLAESVFLTAQTTPGLTHKGAQRLADETMLSYGLTVTEMVHRVGGTLDMALGLTEAAGDAYGARLAELSTGHGHGGAA